MAHSPLVSVQHWAAKCNRWPSQQAGASLGKKLSSREKSSSPWVGVGGCCEKSPRRLALETGRGGRAGGSLAAS